MIMAAQSIDLSNVPGKVTITNNGTKDAKLNISGYNQSFTLAAGASVTLLAQTSSELIGYLSQETDDIEVTLPTAGSGS